MKQSKVIKLSPEQTKEVESLAVDLERSLNSLVKTKSNFCIVSTELAQQLVTNQTNFEETSDVQVMTQQDREFIERFKLLPSEVIIKTFPCIYKKTIQYEGELYLSQNFVCFYAQLFGTKTKVRTTFSF